MLNNSLFSGGYEARGALAKASLLGEVGADWCLGVQDCVPWGQSVEGRQRYVELRARWLLFL